MYTIEKGIPIPTRASNRENPFPLAEMELNDSFTIPLNKRSLYARYKVLLKKNSPDKDFYSQVQGDQVRVWRIK